MGWTAQQDKRDWCSVRLVACNTCHHDVQLNGLSNLTLKLWHSWLPWCNLVGMIGSHCRSGAYVCRVSKVAVG